MPVTQGLLISLFSLLFSFLFLCVALGMAQQDYHSANKTLLFNCQSGYDSIFNSISSDTLVL
jgi:hypothetical protein